MAILTQTKPLDARERVEKSGKMLIYGILLGICGWYYGIGLGTFNSFMKPWAHKALNDPSDAEVKQVSQYVTLAFFAGCTTACLIGSKLIEVTGLYRALIINHVLAIALTLPMVYINVKLLYGLRFFQGVSAYLWTTIAPLMIKDNLPESLAEKIKPVFNTSIATGILVGYAFGTPFFSRNWLLVVLFPLVSEVPKLLLFLYFRMESPAWMASVGRDHAEIKANYMHFYDEYIAEELTLNILEEQRNGQNTASVPFSRLFTPNYRMQIVVVIVLNLLNQLTGMNIITVFSTEILEKGGVSNAEMYTTGLGFFGALATFSLVFLKMVCSVRNLMTFGLFGQALGLCIFLGGLAYSLPIMVILGLYVGMCAYNISLGGLLFSYNADLVPPVGLSSCAMLQWIIACLLVLFIRDLQAKLSNEGLFFGAQICATLGGIFYLGYGIDTTNKKPQTIIDEFKRKTFFSYT